MNCSICGKEGECDNYALEAMHEISVVIDIMKKGLCDGYLIRTILEGLNWRANSHGWCCYDCRGKIGKAILKHYADVSKEIVKIRSG